MKKKRNIWIMLFTFFVISISVWSCQWHKIEPVKAVPGNLTDTISFSADIQPIFDSKCISCHANQSPYLTADKSYESLVNGGYINTTDPEKSGIYTRLHDDQHPSPSGTFSQSEMNLLLTWLQQGALNN